MKITLFLLWMSCLMKTIFNSLIHPYKLNMYFIKHKDYLMQIFFFKKRCFLTHHFKVSFNTHMGAWSSWGLWCGRTRGAPHAVYPRKIPPPTVILKVKKTLLYNGTTSLWMTQGQIAWLTYVLRTKMLIPRTSFN